ncbi:MAG: STAS domain-containing protein [Candidatus Omnitrophota bacterium]
MNTKVTMDGDKATVSLSGTIDIPNAEILKSSLIDLLKEELKEVVVNFAQVDSIGSSGIGALLLAHKEYTARNVKFNLINLNKEITALFKIIKLDRLFKLPS